MGIRQWNHHLRELVKGRTPKEKIRYVGLYILGVPHHGRL